MRPVPTDFAHNMVCAYVCLCVWHAGELCKMAELIEVPFGVVLLRFQKFCCRSVSVGLARKTAVFGFGFCLSRFPPVVNVVRLCGPLHIKPAAVRYIFLCITPVDSSKYPTVWDWWRHTCCETVLVWQSAPPTSVASEHLYSSASSMFRDRRNRLGSKKLICCSLSSITCLWSVLNTEFSVHEIDHWHVVLNKWALTVTLYSWLI